MSIEELTKQFMNLLGQNKPQEALQISQMILALRPRSAHYYYNHAMLAKELHLGEEVVNALYQVIERRPNCPIMHRMLADACNSLCRWREGFEHAEWRFNWPLEDSPATLAPIPAVLELMPRFRRAYKQPYWNGKDSLKNKTILIFNEAGFGDCIQNIRYAKYLKPLGAHVILETKPELQRVIQKCQGINKCILLEREKRIPVFLDTFTNKQSNPDFPPHDYVVSGQTLPYYFDPDLTHIPADFPYLFPEKGCIPACQLITGKKFNVGIVWAGNEKDYNDRHRSCWLKHFQPLAELPDIQLFSLQKGKMKRLWICEPDPDQNVDLLEGSENMNVIDLSSHLNDFNDTAEVMRHLDLIISADTAVVHLAGAINRPIWMINSHLRHDMRWTLKWYDSLHIVHQENPGDWEGLMQSLAHELLTIT